MSESELLAYIAGVLDSDGHITIKRMHPNGEHKSYLFAETVSLGQTSPIVVDLCWKRWGGRRIVRDRNGRGKHSKNLSVMYEWCVSDRKACAAISAVVPFLRIKTDQANILLKLREHKNLGYKETRNKKSDKNGGRSRLLSDETVQYRTSLYEQIRALHDNSGKNKQTRMA